MRYYLDSFGCVKNQVDAETMMAHLDRASWVSADNPDDADVIIINSCGFIESAKRESINAVLLWRARYPRKKIILAGCLAQRYAGELELPEADALFGNDDLAGITGAAAAVVSDTFGGGGAAASAVSDTFGGGGAAAAMVSDTFGGGGAAAAVSDTFLPGARPLLSPPGCAYVKISEGCNNRCSFCAIPLIRGTLRSRPIPDVVEECRQLLARGVRELCLIGQDLASFGSEHGAASALPALLEELATLEGRFWVRLLYIHPDHFPLAILDTIKRDARFLPYFDIPFQHGSSSILRAMNRRGSAAAYLDLIGKIRAALPDAVIRSTFLVAFPGESDADFQALLEFQEAARLDWAGCFTYSREENTPAYNMKNRVPKRVATERKALVEERQISISEGQMERFVGLTLDALLEETIDAEDGLYLGRLFCQAPEVDGAVVITSCAPLKHGEFITGKITARAGFDLEMRVR